jgi:hypothetical protein
MLKVIGEEKAENEKPFKLKIKPQKLRVLSQSTDMGMAFMLN